MSRALESLPGLSRPSSRAWVGLVLLAAGLLGPAVATGLRAPASRFVVVYAVAVAGFLLLVSARDALPLRAVVVVAVLARLAFLPVAPALSDDHYRYLWDGRVQLAGVNPYLYAPEDARLDEVAFEGRDLVNHPDLRTPYPPLAQAFFLGLAGLLALSLLFRGRGQTAAVFAWSWTLVVLLLPSVHPWYWIGPAALGLAAGVWTPVLLGLAAPLRYARWPQTLRSDLLVSIATYLPALAAVPELTSAWRRRTTVPTPDHGTGARRPDRSCP